MVCLRALLQQLLMALLLIHLPCPHFPRWFKAWTGDPAVTVLLLLHLKYVCECVCMCVCVSRLTTAALTSACKWLCLYLSMCALSNACPRFSLINRGRVNGSHRGQGDRGCWAGGKSVTQSISTTGQTQALLIDIFAAEVCSTVKFMCWTHIKYRQRWREKKKQCHDGTP